jgi:cysteine-rich repeat protein
MTRARPPVPGRGALTVSLLLLAGASAACFTEPEAQSCPTGIYCPAGARCAARQAACIFDDCGDGVLQPGEVCDDGNILDGDGCSHDCQSDESCGNWIIDTAVGEVCDDGNTLPGDGCAADCKSLEKCGDSRVDPGEDCDSGGESRGCNADCTWARHGDGKVNAAAGEACDGDGAGNGNGVDCLWQGCNANCTLSVHGDGWVNPLDGELCDGDGRGTGNHLNCQSATCNADCTPSRCGDGIPNLDSGEDCDDGNLSNEDACRNDCRWNVCGDGLVNRAGTPPAEACDLGAENGNAVCAYGLSTCERCSASCTVLVPITHYCGDGVVDATLGGEACDDPRSFVCGTCGASTCQEVSLAAATGTITVASTAISDGDTLTIDDGVNPPVTFEFDLDGALQVATNARVDLVGAGTVEAVTARIRSALSLVGAALAVEALPGAAQEPIALRNAVKGVIGNSPIEVSGASVVIAPAAGAVVVEGLAGGVGCANGASCHDSRDCVSGRCSRSICKAP